MPHRPWLTLPDWVAVAALMIDICNSLKGKKISIMRPVIQLTCIFESMKTNKLQQWNFMWITVLFPTHMSLEGFAFFQKYLTSL